MKKLLLSLLTIATLSFIGASLIAVDVSLADAKTQITNSLNNVNDGNTTDLGGGIKTAIDMLLFLIGAVSVVVIIIGGIKYVTSNGDSGSIQSAKNTIMYAVIGLLVAILAYSIVNFVVGQFTN